MKIQGRDRSYVISLGGKNPSGLHHEWWCCTIFPEHLLSVTYSHTIHRYTTSTHTWSCEKGHVDSTTFWQAVLQAHIERTSGFNDKFPSTPTFCLSPSHSPSWRPSCLFLSLTLTVQFFFFSIMNICWCIFAHTVFLTLVWILTSSISAGVSTREHGCVGRWVCLHMRPAFIIQFSLWAAGRPPPPWAQMAFDNGLNRQMPGRHLAIDHSSVHCFPFPWKPPGEWYLNPASNQT